MSEAVSWRARLWDVFQDVVGGNEEKKASLVRALPQPGRLLEIGCATGNVADVFRDFDYVGVDIDEQAIALARRKFPGPGYRFHCLDVLEEGLPEEAHFDHVLISHTAHHLPDDYFARVLHRSAELLGQGGTLVILDMVRPEPHEPFGKQFYYKLDRGRHFRNVAEFEALIRQEPLLEEPEIEVVKVRKFGIEVIDDLLIRARRRVQST